MYRAGKRETEDKITRGDGSSSQRKENRKKRGIKGKKRDINQMK